MSDVVDRLARFRKGSGTAEHKEAASEYATRAQADDSDEYLAFKAIDRPPKRLLVRPVGAAREWIAYQYLLRVVLDSKQTRLALIFSFMAVNITGRNLGPIAEALADERADFIEQYDSRQWKRPAPDAPIIDTIEFVTGRSSEDGDRSQ